MSTKSGNATLLSFKKIESEMQESGIDWGKKNEVEVESKEGESERIEEEEELDAKGKICS